MAYTDYQLKFALPNKSYNEDGTTTDLLGNVVQNPVPEYENKQSLPNKWLNPDGSYSTLLELISGAIDTELFIVVEELPESGQTNKIYLVPDGEGGFNEYHYIDGKWDPVGAIDTRVNPQIFYWDGNTKQAGLDFWNNIYQLQKTQPCLVYTEYGNEIIQSWYYNNNLPTSIFDTNAVSRWFGDKATSNGRQSLVTVYNANLYFSIENDIVINIYYVNNRNRNYTYLDTNEDYSQPYVPLYPGSPATKKYVDDSIATNITEVLNKSF